MEQTLRHIDETYDGVDPYLRHIGLTQVQLTSLRNRLLGD